VLRAACIWVVFMSWQAKWECSPHGDDLTRDLGRMQHATERGTRYYFLPRPTAKSRFR
jgi:hypothetical protein